MMKRTWVVLLVLLALIVLISPGIVGRLAEQNLEWSVPWPEQESGDVVGTRQAFDRGWFMSEGRQRIEIRNALARKVIEELVGPLEAGATPALIVDTRIDHGLVPITSMSREAGTLKPGLASAVSVLQLDPGNGELIDIPGKLHSHVGLTGTTTARYLLEPGSVDAEGLTAEWRSADVTIAHDPSDLTLEYEGSVEPLSLDLQTDAGIGAVNIGEMHFDGAMRDTEYGFMVGTNSIGIDSARVALPDGSIGFEELTLESRNAVDGERLDGELTVSVSDVAGPASPEFDLVLKAASSGNARVIQAFTDALRAVQQAGGPRLSFADPGIEGELRTLLSRGAELRVDRLDVSLPQGTIEAELEIDFPGNDTAGTLSWPTLVLAMTASADIAVPAALVELARANHPQAASLVAMGILKEDGEVYVMSARYAKGLLTINGAPMPVPLPGR